MAAWLGTHVISQGIKLELFIFDTFHTASRVALMEVERAAEFAPVKVTGCLVLSGVQMVVWFT
jgi:UDP-N-acetylglucosamine pyrophosphorylase